MIDPQIDILTDGTCLPVRHRLSPRQVRDVLASSLIPPLPTDRCALGHSPDWGSGRFTVRSVRARRLDHGVDDGPDADGRAVGVGLAGVEPGDDGVCRDAWQQ